VPIHTAQPLCECEPIDNVFIFLTAHNLKFTSRVDYHNNTVSLNAQETFAFSIAEAERFPGFDVREQLF